MKRAAVTALAFLTLAAATVAQAPAAWVTYSSPDGRFSARFPRTPATSTQQSKNKDGEPLTQHMISAQDGDDVFLLGHFEILPGQVFTMSEARDGMVRNVNGTLLSETAITLGAYSGVDLVITAEAQGNAYVMNVRAIHTPRRAYVIQAIFLRNAPYQSEKTARFFSSFQLTQ
jgi:hypothetical protein